MMPTEFAAIIAIDWADQKHAATMQAGTSKVEQAPSTTHRRRLKSGQLNVGGGSEDSLLP
jgi:hypothetical protein